MNVLDFICRNLNICFLIFLVWNFAVFILYGADKRRAKNGGQRIRERTLLAAAFLFGGIGAWLGMCLFRHKTRHKSFVLTVPFAALIQLALIIFVILRCGII